MTDVDPDDATGTERPSGLSRWSIVTVVAIVLAAVLVLALAAVGIDSLREDRPRAKEGQVFDPSTAPEEPLEEAGTVFLPWARLTVAVGEPGHELPTLGSEESDVAPPEGGSFVRVEVDKSDEDVEFAPLVATRDSRDLDVRIVLVADDVDYPLDGPEGLDFDSDEPSWSSPSATRWVAVPGEPTDLAVEVIVDGQVQTVDDEGDATRRRAQDLADLPSVDEMGRPRTSCGKARRDDESSLRLTGLSTCEISASLRTPYVDGLGWAPEGREYLAVEVEHDLAAKGTKDGLEWKMSVDVDGRVGDRRPAAVLTSSNHGTAFSRGVSYWKPHLVFEVPAGETADDLTLRFDVEAVSGDPFTEDESAQLEWTIPGRDLP